MTGEVKINSEVAAFARDTLLRWYRESSREFPWRNDRNSYHILIAEMMLRRTQARQVVGVYLKFLEDYPDVESLAKAPSEQIKASLYPLGLAWRAENFEQLAKAIVERYGGEIPEDRVELLTLPGVGPYVADAVRVFAFGKQGTLVDTNTVRVAARVFGFEYDQESRRKPVVIQAVSELINKETPAESNYALLDFAATVCQARTPLHDKCPLLTKCAFFLRKTNKIQDAAEINSDSPGEERE
jgi:A/G-specific adenine glycosylase